MKYLSLILTSAILLMLCGCPPAAKNSSGNDSATQTSQTTTQTAPALKLALLASDLGLGDGWHVRQLDRLFKGRAADGSIEYSLIGELPREIKTGEISLKVGVPDPLSDIPGSMTALQADELLEGAPVSDILVLTSGYVLQHVLDRIDAGTLQTGAVILVEEAGSQGVVNNTGTPVYKLRFDIRHAAFMSGLAAARSANVAHFKLLGAEDDPQLDEFMSAASAGLKYMSPSAWIKEVRIPVDSRGMVSQQAFRQAHVNLLNEAGKNFSSNHFILDLTRSTPWVTSIIAEPGGQLNGYVTGGYEDLRHIAESRILTIGVKKADVALAWLLDNCDGAGGLQSVASGDYIEFGLAGSRPGLDESAVGYTSLDLYSRYNPDGEDIAEELEVVWGEIEAGELGIDY